MSKGEREKRDRLELESASRIARDIGPGRNFPFNLHKLIRISEQELT